MPTLMRRDQFSDLGDLGASRPQVEFVVDNQVVAGLANATLSIENSTYEALIRRIRVAVAGIYSRRCECKGGFLEPVDWRAREWNRGADFLANHALLTRSSGGTLTPANVREALVGNTALQFFSDGGYVDNVGGSFGVQVLCHSIDEGGHMRRHMIGYLFEFVADARTVFEMELEGLHAALALMENI